MNNLELELHYQRRNCYVQFAFIVQMGIRLSCTDRDEAIVYGLHLLCKRHSPMRKAFRLWRLRWYLDVAPSRQVLILMTT